MDVSRFVWPSSKHFNDQKRLQLWFIESKHVRNLFGKGDLLSVTSIEFSPNGRSLVSGSLDGILRIWNIRDGSSKQILVTIGYTDLRVAFSPTGRHVAAGTGDGVLCIVDVRTQRQVKRWEGHQNDVSSLGFVPNGKEILSSSFDGTVKIWDVSDIFPTEWRRGIVKNSVTLIREFGGYPVRFGVFFSHLLIPISFFDRSTAFVLSRSQPMVHGSFVGWTTAPLGSGTFLMECKSATCTVTLGGLGRLQQAQVEIMLRWGTSTVGSVFGGLGKKMFICPE